jgi:hypothetical protein
MFNGVTDVKENMGEKLKERDLSIDTGDANWV